VGVDPSKGQINLYTALQPPLQRRACSLGNGTKGLRQGRGEQEAIRRKIKISIFRVGLGVKGLCATICFVAHQSF